MRTWMTILFVMVMQIADAQYPPVTQRHEQDMEDMAERTDAEMEDDSYLQQLERLRRRPLDLNTVMENELRSLQMLTGIQVKALLQYRALLGRFVHVYELQAIPYWDVATIQKVLPFVRLGDAVQVPALNKGSSQLMLRMSGLAGRSKQSTGEEFVGSPPKLLVRYRYNYKNVLQAGMLGDKDAGEQLSRSFYSFHLFARRLGIVQSLAVGDFTVNMGQGLIHWQSLSFRKSSDITALKRQSAILRPYGSAGEYNFHRGAGITLQKKHWQLTAFGSIRKLSANLSVDTLGTVPVISSILISGLHRTASEIETRNNIRQHAFGGSIGYDNHSWHVGANVVYYDLSKPIQKRGEPYNLFSIRGSRWGNYSLDYDHTWRNLHFFGEIAVGTGSHKAFISGLLASLDRRVDASLVFRHLEPGFQSMYSSAFTESTLPSNESGLFLGVSLRPVRALRLDCYADIFHFPWLRFRVDAPSEGREYLLQFMYKPHKRLEISGRFRAESKPGNAAGDHYNMVMPGSRSNWRVHITWHPGPQIRLRQRVELVKVKGPGVGREDGYLIYNDIGYHPANKPFDLAGRIQLFETDGFNSRIYAFENDVPYGYSIPAVYHKGLRYYFILNFKPPAAYFKRLAPSFSRVYISLRWGQTMHETHVWTAFERSNTPEFKMQLIFFQD